MLPGKIEAEVIGHDLTQRDDAVVGDIAEYGFYDVTCLVVRVTEQYLIVKCIITGFEESCLSSALISDRPAWPSTWSGGETRRPKAGRHFAGVRYRGGSARTNRCGC